MGVDSSDAVGRLEAVRPGDGGGLDVVSVLSLARFPAGAYGPGAHGSGGM